MSSDDGRFYLTRRTKRRLRSLAIGLVTVAVIGIAGVAVMRRERAPTHPVTPAEADWAGTARPLLLAVDRIVNRHDALVAATAATGRQALRPTLALLATIRLTLRQLRRLPPAPLRLSPIRSESIDAVEDALGAYDDYAAGARTGSAARLAAADREWDAALGDLAHLDQLATTGTVPPTIKPAGPEVSFAAYEAALAAARPQVRAAQAAEASLLGVLRARHSAAETGRLASHSAATFSSLSLQAAGLPTAGDDVSALNLQYENSLHHAVLAANLLLTGLQNSDGAQIRQGIKAYATSRNTYRGFLRNLSRYGATLTATAAAS